MEMFSTCLTITNVIRIVSEQLPNCSQKTLSPCTISFHTNQYWVKLAMSTTCVFFCKWTFIPHRNVVTIMVLRGTQWTSLTNHTSSFQNNFLSCTVTRFSLMPLMSCYFGFGCYYEHIHLIHIFKPSSLPAYVKMQQLSVRKGPQPPCTFVHLPLRRHDLMEHKVVPAQESLVRMIPY